MIDREGYRANVGIVLINKYREVFWGKRVGQLDAWQFPQGGIDKDETPEDALYRELYEEVGLVANQVKLLSKTKHWLRYRLPNKYRRFQSKPLCIGQKQKWFLLEVYNAEQDINFNRSANPEFEHWRWVDYWYPIKHVIKFKSQVYEHALEEFKPVVFGEA